MTGVSWPASISSVRSIKSFFLTTATNGRPFLRMTEDDTRATAVRAAPVVSNRTELVQAKGDS